MRSIVCRFKDEADFLHHYRVGYSTRGQALTIVTDVDLEAGERLRFHGLVSNLRESFEVGTTIFEKTRVGLDDGNKRARYRYVCVVDSGDKVWLDMFVQKVTMMSQIALKAA